MTGCLIVPKLDPQLTTSIPDLAPLSLSLRVLPLCFGVLVCGSLFRGRFEGQ